jgi:hypothetical protein
LLGFGVKSAGEFCMSYECAARRGARARDLLTLTLVACKDRRLSTLLISVEMQDFFVPCVSCARTATCHQAPAITGTPVTHIDEVRKLRTR